MTAHAPGENRKGTALMKKRTLYSMSVSRRTTDREGGAANTKHFFGLVTNSQIASITMTAIKPHGWGLDDLYFGSGGNQPPVANDDSGAGFTSVDLVLSAEFDGGDALGPDLIGGDSVRIMPPKK